MEEHFNLKPSTTFTSFNSDDSKVEEHFNLKPSTTIHDFKKSDTISNEEFNSSVTPASNTENSNLKKEIDDYINHQFSLIVNLVNKNPDVILFYNVNERIYAEYNKKNKCLFFPSDVITNLTLEYGCSIEESELIIKKKFNQQFNLQVDSIHFLDTYILYC